MVGISWMNYLAQDKENWRAPVNTVKILGFL